MYFPKTNMFFEKDQSIVNHAKHNYPTMEDAYNDVHGIETPICKYCDNEAALISIFKGYYKICLSKECIYAQTCDANKQIAENKSNNLIKDPNYIQHIKDNIDFYKRAKPPFYDNYLKVEVNDTRIYFNKKKITDKKICMITGKEYEYEYFYHDDLAKYISYDKSTSFIRSKISYKELLDVINSKNNIDIILQMIENNKSILNLLKQLIGYELIYKECNSILKRLKRKEIIPKTFELDLNGYKLTFSKERGQRINLTSKIPVDILNEIFNEQVVFNCLNCNKEYSIANVVYKYNNGYVDYYINKNLSKISCGKRDCYSNVRKKFPELFKFSEERKNKQSDTMKKKIKRGEFIPTNNRTSKNYKIDNLILKSSWEVIFYCYMKMNNIELKYENIIIQYNDKNNYFVDFYDEENKIIYEVKPESQLDKPKIKMKTEAALKYAEENNMKYILITENWFIENINKDLYTFINNEDIMFKDKVINVFNDFIKRKGI